MKPPNHKEFKFCLTLYREYTVAEYLTTVTDRKQGKH